MALKFLIIGFILTIIAAILLKDWNKPVRVQEKKEEKLIYPVTKTEVKVDKLRKLYRSINAAITDEDIDKAIDDFLHQTTTVLSQEDDMDDRDRFLMKMDDLMDQYSSAQGRIDSWWQRGKSASRTKLITQHNQEAAEIFTAGAIDLGLRQQQEDRRYLWGRYNTPQNSDQHLRW